MSSLIQRISNKRTISRAWKVVSKNRFVAPGIDKVTVKDFESSKKIHIEKIVNDLRSGGYTFTPSRKKLIPKPSGSFRKIHVFAIRDKVVQQAIQSLFLSNKPETALFPEVYNDVAIAYIPRLNGVAYAVKKIKDNYSNGLIYLSTLDIKDFFDNIKGKKLLKKIIIKLPDNSIDWLIKKTIDQEVYHDKTIDPVSQVLQGSVLAPLYSNIFLSEFDKSIINAEIPALRYADDLAIFSKTSEDAKKIKILCKKILKNSTGLDFYLDNHKTKAPKDRCLNQYAEFLGIRFSKGAKKWLVVEPTRSKVKSQKEKITDIFSFYERDSIAECVLGANRSTESWLDHYWRAGCQNRPMKKVIKEILEHYNKSLSHTLRKIRLLKSGILLNKYQFHVLGAMKPKQIKKKRR